MSKKPLDTTDMIESSDDFETAYESYAQDIYRFLFWRTKNTAVSEDLKSRVFEKAWGSRDSFQGGSVKAWLYRIARNVLIDHWRRKQDILVADIDILSEETSSDSTDEKLDTEAVVKELRKAMTKLPKDMRSVIALRFIEGLSCREVALRLHLSESNVRVLQYRALQKLRGYLQ